MNYFYFNECLPKIYNGSITNVFESAIENFKNLIVNEELKIANGVITHKMPSDFFVCGVNLKDIITSCSDKELRTLAFKYFTKFPIDSQYKFEDIFSQEELNVDYSYNGDDAINLIIAHKMNWCLFSLPLTEQLCSDKLSVLHTDGQNTDINNWHGGNDKFIEDYIASKYLNGNPILQLEANFIGKQCKLSEDFIESYISSPPELQSYIIAKLSSAQQRGLLFPARSEVGSQFPLVKSCRGKGNEDTYELRSKSWAGLRVYFACDKDTLFIGGIGTKASSEGKEQSADISRASNEIRKLRTR